MTMDSKAAASSNPGEKFRHKNRLQEYTQKSGLPMPAYHTVNEGFQHAPWFRSTVMVAGMVFRSSHTFSHRKEAEQYAAKVALEGITMKDLPTIPEDTLLCKSILYEYAIKTNTMLPVYKTIQSDSLLPVFTSSVAFDGNTYSSNSSESKTEAEGKSARVAIQSILEKSESRTVILRIIKTKEQACATAYKHGGSYISKDNSMNMKRQAENSSCVCNQKVQEEKPTTTAAAKELSENLHAEFASTPYSAYKPDPKKPRKD